MKTIRNISELKSVSRLLAALLASAAALSLSTAAMAQPTYSVSEIGTAN